MECNKVEANRAKDIAEKKMQSRDFVGAKKLLLKASHLFPDIENASHMIAVCEVHCSADNLVNGQVDHYGILQVEYFADDSLIRKQYRRLALLLHPDKNKFAGAEAAFKLVGDAYKVLSDKANRQEYDLKSRFQARAVPPRQTSHHTKDASGYSGANTAYFNNQFGGAKPQVQQPTSTFFASQRFWTLCAFCSNIFQYSRQFLNREVQCQRCFRKFLAFELNPQSMPPPGSASAFPWSHTGFNQTGVPGHYTNHGSKPHFGIPATTVSENVNSAATASMHEKRTTNKEKPTGNQVKSEIMEDKPAEKHSSGNAQKKHRRNIVSSSDSDSAESDSCESDEIECMDEVDLTVPDVPTSSRYPRRSTRSTVKVSYKVIDSDDDEDFVYPSKKSRKSGTDLVNNQDAPSRVVANGLKTKTSDSPAQMGFKKDEKQVRASSNGESEVESLFSYPDSEFYDFEKDRHRNKFAANQIWAAYDDHDAMPRFYALIQRVFSPFKLQYTWLECNPTSVVEKAWVGAELPIACGNFTLGRTDTTTSEQIFSHLICYDKVDGKTYNVYPKKGEVWALFKDWDVGWSSIQGKPKKYEYEFVELVSDFTYEQDVGVVHLVKVKGYRYLFAKAHDEGLMLVPSGQLLRFSHRIPCSRVGERKGIPKDSFELDPAALPHLKMTDTVGEERTQPRENHGSSTEQEDTTEFYNFQEERSEEKFKKGQIWAVYGDDDGYPNYYALIKEADWEGNGFVDLKWLELVPATKKEKLLLKNELSVGCGRFKVVSGVQRYDSTCAFSHLVHAKVIRKNILYEIYPNVGEVWAILKNWNGNTDKEQEQTSDYGIVEIIDREIFSIKVMYLTKVRGYKYVFMPETECIANIMIPEDECLRFSHQVPAFRLTDEDSGKLNGYWELDPDSIPKMLLSMES